MGMVLLTIAKEQGRRRKEIISPVIGRPGNKGRLYNVTRKEDRTLETVDTNSIESSPADMVMRDRRSSGGQV